MEDFACFLDVRRAGFLEEPTAEETELIGRHFEYLKGLTARGTVVLAGPCLEPPHTGIVVLRAADREAAQAVVDADPAVAGGLFEARLSSFRISLLAVRDA